MNLETLKQKRQQLVQGKEAAMAAMEKAREDALANHGAIQALDHLISEEEAAEAARAQLKATVEGGAGAGPQSLGAGEPQGGAKIKRKRNSK